MPELSGRERSIGLGREVTWGTGVAPTKFIVATENLPEDRAVLREQMRFGTRATPAGVNGRLSLAGGTLGQMYARPAILGELLRAKLGAAASSGADPNYTHTWSPKLAKYAANNPLPGISITVKRLANLIQRYSGGQFGQLTFTQSMDGVLLVAVGNILFKTVADGVADPTPAYETADPFLYRHLTAQRNGSDYCVENLTITVTDPLEPVICSDGEDTISKVGWGDADSTVAVQMTLTFEDPNVYQDFRDGVTHDWSFVWQQSATNEFGIDIPKFRIDPNGWGSPTERNGRLTQTVNGLAEFSASDGYDALFTLKDAVATYT